MDKIFLPNDNIYNKCYVVQSEGVIRGYDIVPRTNANYNYRDYYIKSNYIYRDGTGSWSQYATLPVCLDSDIVVHDYWYRLDLANILTTFLIINIFGIYLPIKIFSKIFRKGVL